jgi:predicted HTH domain antitoxin
MYTMPVISARIPDELEKEINEFVREEGLEKSVAIRKLLSISIAEWKKEKALRLLAEGKVSFLRAAEISGMDVWDFTNLVKEKKLTWIRNEGVLRDSE